MARVNMKNIFISFVNGYSVLIYAGEGLSVADCCAYMVKLGSEVHTAFEVDEQCAKYMTGGRVELCNVERVASVKRVIGA